MSKRKGPTGKGPTVIPARSPGGEIPATWLGGFLRAGSTGKWKDVLGVYAEMGTAYPDLGDFAIQADLTLQEDPEATVEGILNELNQAREAKGNPRVESLSLISQTAGALALVDRAQAKMVLSAWEPRVVQALVEGAVLPKGTKDRENFLLVQGLLRKGQGVSVRVDTGAKSLSLGGVEADNREFQALLEGGGEIAEGDPDD